MLRIIASSVKNKKKKENDYLDNQIIVVGYLENFKVTLIIVVVGYLENFKVTFYSSKRSAF